MADIAVLGAGLDGTLRSFEMPSQRLRGIPALLLFHLGGIRARTAGVMDANHIAAWARRHAAMAETVPGAKGFER